jgi:hypothetical protein
MATMRPEKRIKKTPKETRVYLRSPNLKNENKAMSTLSSGVNIKTRSPILTTPWGCNLDELSRSSSKESGDCFESWVKPPGVIRNKINPKIRRIRAE